MIDKIRTKKQYDQVMKLIEGYLQKATDGGGFSSLKKADADELHRLTLLAAAYEDSVMKIMPLPVTLPAMIGHKMEELNITQAKLAEMLNVDQPKLSQILNGRRQPDVPFLKAVYKTLHIDADFILEHV
jgi:antitoxin component HigA of HigAB toxin-antitoxin module